MNRQTVCDSLRCEPPLQPACQIDPLVRFKPKLAAAFTLSNRAIWPNSNLWASSIHRVAVRLAIPLLSNQECHAP